MDRTFRRALVLAAVVHASGLIVARIARTPDAAPIEAPPTDATVTELVTVELPDPANQGAMASVNLGSESATGTPSAGNIADPRAPAIGIAIRPVPAPIPEPTTSTSTSTTTATAETAKVEGAPDTPAATTTTTGAPAPYVVPELGKKSSWLLPPILPNAVGAAGTGSPLDPKSAQKLAEEKLEKKLSQDITALVDAKGKSKSGGAGGPVIGAAHAAAHDEPLAPATGIAVFEVKTDAAGAVSSVTVLSTDGDAPAWNVVAVAMKKDLASKKLVVPSGAGGLKVTVRIQAKLALPSGATGSGVKPYVGGIGGGFGFDLSDIGQKPMRVVSVVELDESRL